ncbi:phage tail domain-containing protein [Anaerotignum sp.]|uniref:phage distal tail protein n=1 Tax=Anaerotignum sp. TaxID=2039241 RepID=UPI0033309BC7
MLITKSTKIIYRNEVGGEIEFSPFSAYFVENIEEETKNNITTNKTNLIHGENYISNTLESRYISLSGLIDKNSTTKALIRNLTKVVNPTLKGKLIYQNENEVKEIEVIPEQIPDINANGGLIRYEVSLMACNPFWKNTEKTEYLALFMPMLTFPLVIEQEEGMVFSLKDSVLETEFNNQGDVESGVRVLFKARGGTVQNPKIMNDLTGEFIKLNYSMEKGDSIEVISYPEKKKVTVNSTINGFRYLDIESNFFNLLVGKNKLSYIADENTINLDVIVYYTPRFLGV